MVRAERGVVSPRCRSRALAMVSNPTSGHDAGRARSADLAPRRSVPTIRQARGARFWQSVALAIVSRSSRSSWTSIIKPAIRDTATLAAAEDYSARLPSCFSSSALRIATAFGPTPCRASSCRSVMAETCARVVMPWDTRAAFAGRPLAFGDSGENAPSGSFRVLTEPTVHPAPRRHRADVRSTIGSIGPRPALDGRADLTPEVLGAVTSGGGASELGRRTEPRPPGSLPSIECRNRM